MATIEEAQLILSELGLPKGQTNKRTALVLLALAGLKPSDPWKKLSSRSMSILGTKNHAKFPGIMRFISEHYGVEYAENFRESIRRQTLHQLVQAGLVAYNPELPNLATNSSHNHYRLQPSVADLLKYYGTRSWKSKLKRYLSTVTTLLTQYQSHRDLERIKVMLPSGMELYFSPGSHNLLQKLIIEEFAEFFAKGAMLVYVGDTSQKDLFIDQKTLTELGINLGHGKLPDVILFDMDKSWVYLIEAVTSHGPISPKRIIELKELFTKSKMGIVFVSAFLTIADFRKYAAEIAWDTEVWIAERPEHMIHFNGDRFIGPR